MMTFLQAAEAVATSEETRMGLWKLFSMGGWLMWPLLALGGGDRRGCDRVLPAATYLRRH